jgi:hypothetical protein
MGDGCLIGKSAVFILLIAFFVACLGGAEEPKKLGKPLSDGGILISQDIAKDHNESNYSELLGRTWSQYNEDLNQSSFILNEFVKKNITNSEAMTATTSLYVLNSFTLEQMNREKPPNRYEINHNSTLRALEALRLYLWNMAKFYETNRISYAIDARENFNSSLYYYNMEKEAIRKLANSSL